MMVGKYYTPRPSIKKFIMAISNLDSFGQHQLLRDNPGLVEVLRVFDGISSHPRPSKGEHEVRAHLIEFAQSQGWEVQQDATGNVAFKIAPTPGREDATPVVLQGHMDIVVTDHDRNLPRIAEIVDQNGHEEGGLWMQTQGRNMTLGADNGIGVSIAMAAMMDTGLEHGPVTILVTVDEETGMTGAKGLDPDLLPETGILINLDSEEGPMDICIGCAGNGDTVAKFPFGDSENLPEGYLVAGLNLVGFPGGHSGIEIHKGNGNAIQSMADLLTRLQKMMDLRLLSIYGGSARNTIPLEARAFIAFPAEDASRVEEIASEFVADLKRGQEVEDPLVTGVLSKKKATKVGIHMHILNPERPLEELYYQDVLVFSGEFQRSILDLIKGVPTGPFASAELPNVGSLITLSNNLGIVKTTEDGVEVINMTRGANIEPLRAKMAEIKAFLFDNGGVVEQEEPSSGWLEDPTTSQAVQMVQNIVREVMGESRFLAYHAGLEAGIISGKRPQLSAVAVGPLILEAHTPRERVSLESVATQLEVLRKVLASVG